MGMYLIDTNVMLAASAAFAEGGHAERAMPKDGDQRKAIHQWLQAFAETTDILVLDDEFLIHDEYSRNMPGRPEQWYGLQVLQSKMDDNLVVWVPITVSEATGEPIAVLDEPYERAVKDPADRKWVACALAADVLYKSVPPIVYGAERDWYEAEKQLSDLGIAVVKLLPDGWYTHAAERT
jgi:hypothetical protein